MTNDKGAEPGHRRKPWIIRLNPTGVDTRVVQCQLRDLPGELRCGILSMVDATQPSTLMDGSEKGVCLKTGRKKLAQ